MKSADIDGNGSADVSFEYDALGRRVARTQGADAVVYFQVDQQTICDYPRDGAAASPTNRYYWGSYIDELIARKATGTGGAVLFAHRNQQNSIYAYSNSSGAVVERIAYTAYGQPTFMNAAGTVQSTSPNSIRYSYTGREWDASLQLHHFRARWMGPVMGRFIGRDPIGYWDGSLFYRSSFGVSDVDPFGKAVQTLRFSCSKSNPRKILEKCDCGLLEAPKQEMGFVMCSLFGTPFPAVPERPFRNEIDNDCYQECGAWQCTYCHEAFHIEQFKKIPRCSGLCDPDIEINVPIYFPCTLRGWRTKVSSKAGRAFAIQDVCKKPLECEAHQYSELCLLEAIKKAPKTCSGGKKSCKEFLIDLYEREIKHANRSYSCGHNSVF